MNVFRFYRLRALSLTPLAFVALFIIYNFSAFLLTSAFTPAVQGFSMVTRKFVPADLPTSGNVDLDELIFRTGDKHGIDPRLLHAVIWQESKYETRSRSHAGARGLMQLSLA